MIVGSQATSRATGSHPCFVLDQHATAVVVVVVAGIEGRLFLTDEPCGNWWLFLVVRED
jgi:hypothetical protein